MTDIPLYLYLLDPLVTHNIFRGDSKIIEVFKNVEEKSSGIFVTDLILICTNKYKVTVYCSNTDIEKIELRSQVAKIARNYGPEEFIENI